MSDTTNTPTEEQKPVNIQDECQTIHAKYGTSEMANYKIQLLFDSILASKDKEIQRLQKEVEWLKSQAKYWETCYNQILSIPHPSQSISEEKMKEMAIEAIDDMYGSGETEMQKCFIMGFKASLSLTDNKEKK